ncbi:MAG: PIN domain-containing protein [Minisyncoccia bacterium]|jgi:predicted nucleic acid-binding protein
MANTKKKIKKKKEELRVVPDSSWLLAKLNSKDRNHVSVESSLGAILPYRPAFYIPILVYMETLSALRRQRIAFSKCYKILNSFLETIHYFEEKKLTTKKLIEKHKSFSRLRISQLKGADFYIATEGLSLNAKILTCDKEMRDRVIKYYKQIYFLSDRAKSFPSELPRLMRDIQ